MYEEMAKNIQKINEDLGEDEIYELE